MSVIFTLVKKELIQTLRDPRMKLVVFVMPIIQMLIFGVAITNEVKNLNVTVCDADHSIMSRSLIRTITASDYFVIHRYAEDCSMIEDDLYKNRSILAIHIPERFEAKYLRGDKAPLQILIDGSDGNTASIAMGYLQRMLSHVELKQVRPRIAVGVRPLPFVRINLETRVFYNPGLESKNYMIPGVITMVLSVLTILLTAMGITKEKESGTFEQLIVSPIRGYELVLGKTIPYAIIGFFDAIMVTIVSVFVFEVPLNGAIAHLAILNFLYVTAMLGLGLFISTVSSSQQQAMMTVFAFLFPALILSDFFFPLDNMPALIRYLTYANPMRYALSAQRGIFLRGSGIEDLIVAIIALGIFTILFLGLGVFRFRKKILS